MGAEHDYEKESKSTDATRRIRKFYLVFVRLAVIISIAPLTMSNKPDGSGTVVNVVAGDPGPVK
jgi:hypothetical protein